MNRQKEENFVKDYDVSDLTINEIRKFCLKANVDTHLVHISLMSLVLLLLLRLSPLVLYGGVRPQNDSSFCVVQRV